MSVGVFESAKYEQAGGNIWPCRAQPETKELEIDSVVNDYPSGAVTSGLPRVRLRKGRRQVGLPIRTVTVRLTANGTGPQAGYLSGTTHRIPVFTLDAFNEYTDGQTGSYLGIACVVIAKSSGD